MKLWLSLLAVDVVSAFLIPYGHPSGQFGVAQRWSSSCSTQVRPSVVSAQGDMDVTLVGMCIRDSSAPGR
eukprot:43757-Eustigmatos_ZCMA.PRE.1